jgi:hypothetical protein
VKNECRRSVRRPGGFGIEDEAKSAGLKWCHAWMGIDCTRMHGCSSASSRRKRK